MIETSAIRPYSWSPLQRTKSMNPHHYYRDDKNNEYYYHVIVLTVFPQPLFVAAVMPRLYAERGVSGHPALKLVDTQDPCCRWTVAYWRTTMREEAEGLPVPVRKTTPFKNTKYTTFLYPHISLYFPLFFTRVYRPINYIVL